MKNPFGADLSKNVASRAKPSDTLKARAVRKPNKGKVSCTFTLSPEMYRRLQEIKIDRGTSLQGLLEEAVDVWLASISEPGFIGRQK